MKYKVGNVVQGKVTGITDYGIFLTLDDGYSGLIHISEISDKFVQNISEYVSLNEILSVKVIECDDVNHKLKLSIKRIHKPSNHVIKEVGEGFGLLEASLPEWIREKQIEMNMNDYD